MLRVFPLVLSILLITCQGAHSSPVPPEALWLDVSLAPYNVHPQKQTPAQVTLGLRCALRDAASGGKTVFLPDGVYTLTSPLEVRSALRGQSRAQTILRLAPHTRGFDDRLHPQSVISLGEASDEETSAVDVVPLSGAAGFSLSKREGTPLPLLARECDAFVSLSDLSIRVEEGNVGAVGVQHAGAARSVLRRVSLRGNGLAGLDCHAPEAGFSLVQDVSVEGFECGVEVTSSQSQGTVMFERLQLELQHTVGFHNGTGRAFVRDLRSRNRVCALQNAGGFVVLDIARLIGAGTWGLDNAGGQLVLRQVRCAGYGATLRDGGRLTTGDIAETVSQGQVFRASGRVARSQLEDARSLGLPERPAPVAPLSPPNDWVSVADFGAKAGDAGDDADAIQRAVDSLSDPRSPSFGKTTLFFPRSPSAHGEAHYLLSHSIQLRGNISRVEGNGVTIGVCGALSKGKGAAFVVQEVTRGQLWLGDFGVNGRRDGGTSQTNSKSENGALVFVEHRSKATLIARDIASREISLYRALPGAGDVFLDNVTGRATSDATALMFERGQNVWARAVSLEGFSCALLNAGARVWMLGLSVQNGARAIDNAGDCEIVGLQVGKEMNQNSAMPLVINRENGRLWTTALFDWRGASPDAIVLDDEDQGQRLALGALPRRRGDDESAWALSLRAGE